MKQRPGFLGAVVLGLCAACAPGDGDRPAAIVADPERRLLLIGVDGASWEEMLPLLRAGELPHIAALAREGYSARLTTMAPALSPVVWTTVATGKSPRKHGIRGFLARDPESGERLPVTSNLRRTGAIWNMLSAAGVEVGVVGWWVTWPAEEVRGWMVSPYSAPGQTTWKGTVYADGRDGQTWPADYIAEVASLIEQGVERAQTSFTTIFPARQGTAPPEYLEAFLKDTLWVHVSDVVFRDVGLDLVARKQPRFAAVYLGGVDVTGHRFWRFAHPEQGDWPRDPSEVEAYGGSLDRYYRWTDAAIGALVAAAAPGTTILLVSDHGMELRRDLRGRPPTPQNLFPEEISGGHEDGPPGVFLLSGPGAARNFDESFWTASEGPPRLGSPSHPAVVDVAPTILQLFGLPVGADMDGRVLTETLAKPGPVRRVETWDPPGAYDGDPTPVRSERTEEVLKRLKGLAYIE